MPKLTPRVYKLRILSLPTECAYSKPGLPKIFCIGGPTRNVTIFADPPTQFPQLTHP
jgi:hypothetical protein